MAYEELVYKPIAEALGISIESAVVIFAIISVWSLIWMGIAMWKAAKKNHLIWFVVFLIVNTLGILEILYIFIFSKMSLKEKTAVKPAGPRVVPKSKSKKSKKK